MYVLIQGLSIYMLHKNSKWLGENSNIIQNILFNLKYVDMTVLCTEMD